MENKKETFYQNMLAGNIIVKKENDKIQIYEKYREQQILKTYWHQTKYHAIHHGTNRILKLLGKKCFDFPKSVYLVQDILKIVTNFNDLILDFFAGSGTTGDAVMQLNADDGGNRKFILVQWDEKIDKKKNSESYTFCTENNFKPVISSITIERLHRAGEKIKAEKKADALDIGYRVFSLTPKPQLIEDENTVFQLEHARTGTIHTLVNMLCATGKPLHSTIEEKEKDILYSVDDTIFVLGNISTNIVEDMKDKMIYIDGYSDISLEYWLNLNISNRDNIKIVY